MIHDIEEALKPADEGKRVLKGALAKKIEVLLASRVPSLRTSPSSLSQTY